MNHFKLFLFILSFTNIAWSFNISPQSGFPVDIPNSNLVRSSSSTIVDITGDNIPEIIIGDSQGKVHVYHGDGTKLWSFNTGISGIESKPAVADLDLDGNKEIIISSGSTFFPGERGFITILNHDGTLKCKYESDQTNVAGVSGIFSSPSVANLVINDSELEIVFGEWASVVTVLDHNCNIEWISQRPPGHNNGIQLPPDYDETIPPYRVYVNDSVWSSAAIADMNNDGQLDIIIGVDSHLDNNNLTINGGRILVINGNDGTVLLAKDIDEVVYSSPAIADLDNDGNLDIIFATGYCWQTAACAPQQNVHSVTNRIYAIKSNGDAVAGWPYELGNYVTKINSPSIADLDKDGSLEVVINATNLDVSNANAGRILAINHDGSLLWDKSPNIPTGGGDIHLPAGAASPIISDITGDGELEVILPSNWDLVVWDKNGTQILPSADGTQRLFSLFTISGTPSIADLDNDGDYEIIATGSNINATGCNGSAPPSFDPCPATIYAWDLDTPTSTFVPWSSFRNGEKNHGVYLSDIIFRDGFE